MNSGLQGGQSIPKWNSRCRTWLYLGTSPRHARSISLVLHLDTARVSPQFHVLHDDFFESVDKTTTYSWPLVVGFADSKVKQPSTVLTKLRSIVHKPALTTLEYDSTPPPNDSRDDDVPIAPEESTNDVGQEEVTNDLPPPSTTTRTSTRVRKPTEAFLQSVAQEGLQFNDFRKKEYVPQTCAFTATHLKANPPAYYKALHQDEFVIQDELTDPIAFLAKVDGDTLYYGKAIKAPDSEKF